MVGNVNHGRRSGATVAGLVLLLACFLMLLMPGRASAGTPQGDNSPPTYGICTQSDKFAADAAAADRQLPVNRWQSVAQGPIHTRLGASTFDDISQKIQRNYMESQTLSIGNTMWQSSVQMTEYSDRFCLADGIGAKVDGFFKAIGTGVVDSGIVSGAVALAIFMCCWRAFRQSTNPWNGIAKVVLTAGVLGAMINGASHTTASSFGTMSPGWIATRINNTVSSLAAGPSTALASASGDLNGLTDNSSSSLSCQKYVKQLVNNYTTTYNQYPGESATATVPKVMDAMWQNSGLSAFVRVQFGTQNDYGNAVYCHLLEFNASTPPSGQLAIMKQIAPGAAKTANLNSLALSGNDSNSNTDRALIGWAACEYVNGWQVDPDGFSSPNSGGGFGAVQGGPDNDTKVSPSTCSDFWGKSKADFDSGASGFEWADSPGRINTHAAGQPDVRDFLLNFHGDANSSATTVAIVFALSSVAVFAVFGLLAGAVILAKILLVVLTLMGIFALIADILLSAGASGSNRSVSLLKTYIGTTFFAFASSLIFGMIAVVAGFMAGVGNDIGGRGSVMSVLWTGLSPVLAVICVQWVFKHILKAPSPFKLSAASTWGAAAGGVALGAGAEAMASRMSTRMKYRSRFLARDGVNRFLGRQGRMFMDPHSGRIHGMPATSARGERTSPLAAAAPGSPAPVGAPTGAAGAGAAAGSAGAATPAGRGSGPAGASSAPPSGSTPPGNTGGQPVPKGGPGGMRAINRAGRRQLAAEAGYTGRLGGARHAMSRAWNNTTKTQKAARTLRLGALAAGAAVLPVALPVTMLGMGILYGLNKERGEAKSGARRRARYQVEQERVSAYHRALDAQRRQEDGADTGPKPGRKISPAGPGSSSTPAAGQPGGKRQTVGNAGGQATVDASGRAAGRGRVPTPGKYGPDGEAPRRAAPRIPAGSPRARVAGEGRRRAPEPVPASSPTPRATNRPGPGAPAEEAVPSPVSPVGASTAGPVGPR